MALKCQRERGQLIIKVERPVHPESVPVAAPHLERPFSSVVHVRKAPPDSSSVD